ncbi:unnamed protein product [Brassica oleracea var. botrytis]
MVWLLKELVQFSTEIMRSERGNERNKKTMKILTSMMVLGLQ